MATIDHPIGGEEAARAGWQRVTGPRLYESAIRIVLAAWWMLLTAVYVIGAVALFRHVETTGWSLQSTVAVLSRCCLCSYLLLIAWITLVRMRPVGRAEGVLPRLSAALGTYLPYGVVLLPMPHLGTAWLALSTLLLITGNVLSVAVLLRLGRSFSILAEARRLVTDGPYAVIRHPLYLAEQTAILGVFIQFASLPAALLCAAQLLCQFQRMRNEEAVLERAFPDYASYRARTARLIPGVW